MMEPNFANTLSDILTFSGIEREIILTTGGEDSMGNLLGMMHSAPPSALQLKAHILKVSLLFLCTTKLY